MFSKTKYAVYDWLEEYGPAIIVAVGVMAIWAIIFIVCLQPPKQKYTTCTWNDSHTTQTATSAGSLDETERTVSVCTEEWK